MAGSDSLEGGLEVGVGLDAVQLRGFDQRGDTAPGGGAFIVAREQCVLAIEGDWPDEIFHAVGVHLDPPVAEEHPQPAPVPGDVGQLLAESRARSSLSHTPNASTSGAVRACRPVSTRF